MTLSDQSDEVLIKGDTIALGKGITHGCNLDAIGTPHPFWVPKPVLVSSIGHKPTALITHDGYLIGDSTKGNQFRSSNADERFHTTVRLLGQHWQNDLRKSLNTACPKVGNDFADISHVKVNPILLG